MKTDDLDWNLVRSFVHVAERGSLSAAARELGLAHPTVARHIQHLEGQLGMSLFDRFPGGLRLNPAGTRLAGAARDMLDGARAFQHATGTVNASGSGRVRITVSEFIADLVPALLQPLRGSGTAGQIDFELLVASELLNLLRNEADIAVRHLKPSQQDLVCRRLTGLPSGLYASQGYLEERGMPRVGNLARHGFIDGVEVAALSRHARRYGFTVTKQQLQFRSDHFSARLNAAITGWGITVVPNHVARHHPELVRVLADVPFDELQMWLVARQDVRTVPYLREAFATVGNRLNDFVERLAQEPSDPMPESLASADGPV